MRRSQNRINRINTEKSKFQNGNSTLNWRAGQERLAPLTIRGLRIRGPITAILYRWAQRPSFYREVCDCTCDPLDENNKISLYNDLIIKFDKIS